MGYWTKMTIEFFDFSGKSKEQEHLEAGRLPYFDLVYETPDSSRMIPASEHPILKPLALVNDSMQRNTFIVLEWKSSRGGIDQFIDWLVEVTSMPDNFPMITIIGEEVDSDHCIVTGSGDWVWFPYGARGALRPEGAALQKRIESTAKLLEGHIRSLDHGVRYDKDIPAEFAAELLWDVRELLLNDKET